MTESIIVKELGSELMVYDAVKDEVHILNATARLIYKLHKEGRSPHEIEQVVRRSFDLKDERDIAEEIRVYLAELKTKGLITSNDD